MPNIKKEEKEAILQLYNKGYKVCSCCKQTLPVRYFSSNYTGSNLLPLTSKCKDCSSKIAKERYANLKKQIKWKKNKTMS